MARPKSEDRRAALLDAATEVFAEQGLGAPTSAVTLAAKIAEGSLFTYFKTKDELIDALYRDLRLQLADAVMAGYPRRATIRDRFQHLWSRYVTWGADHPKQMRVVRLTHLSSSVSERTRAESNALFLEVDDLKREAVTEKKISPIAAEMAGDLLKALGEMTMDLMVKHPRRRAEFADAGFVMLWAALTGRG